MAVLQWYRFMFFDREIVQDAVANVQDDSDKEEDDKGKLNSPAPSKLGSSRSPSPSQQPQQINVGSFGSRRNVPFEGLKDINIAASSSGRGHLVFGDAYGKIYILDRNLEIYEFIAFHCSLTHIQQMRHYDVIFALGTDEQHPASTIVKCWKLGDHFSDIHGKKSLKLNLSNETTVTTFAVLDDMSRVAVGCDDGSILLVTGNLTCDSKLVQKLLHKEAFPITGLQFKKNKRTNEIYLFASSTDKILMIRVGSGRKDFEIIELDRMGCPLHCFTMTDAGQILMTRPKDPPEPSSVHYYDEKGPGNCICFDGQVRKVYWFRTYFVVIGTKKGGPNADNSNIVTVYDMSNKFIAFAGIMPPVIEVLSEWGNLYFVTNDGNKLVQLSEKDTQTKLEMLFRKNFYNTAIDLAKGQNYDKAGISEIYMQYGDHLYNKGDFDGAIRQYGETIGILEPSYVIRKFLDAQRIHNLTNYLQALHEHKDSKEGMSIVTADHTTLLLNCYTKLKDVKRLDEFIMSNKDVNFDTETAIKVCRQAGYYKHSLFLAKKHSQHDWYLKIQLENIRNYEDAIEYIWTLPFVEAEMRLKTHGKTLMENIPSATTKLLMSLCTDYTPTIVRDEGDPDSKNGRSSSNISEMSHLSYMSYVSTVDGPTRRGTNPQLIGGNRQNLGAADSFNSKTEPSRAKAEDYIHIFVNNLDWLLVFLEHIVYLQPDSPPIIFNTLLELYLQENVGVDPRLDQSEQVQGSELVELRKAKAIDLIRNPETNYDIDHAMVLAQTYDFKNGIIYLFEKTQQFNNIVQYYMEREEYREVIAKCQKYGKQDPTVWIMVLIYFSGLKRNCEKEIMEVLLNIDEHDLLPPLLVVEILSKNESLTLSVVKKYISDHLQQERMDMIEDEELLKKYREDSLKMQKRTEALRKEAKIIQANRCSSCQRPLDLPTIHFMCDHSYHHMCLSHDDKECPACAGKFKDAENTILSQEKNAKKHDLFFKQLEDDGFSVIAEYFGKGMFNNKATLPSDATFD